MLHYNFNFPEENDPNQPRVVAFPSLPQRVPPLLNPRCINILGNRSTGRAPKGSEFKKSPILLPQQSLLCFR